MFSQIVIITYSREGKQAFFHICKYNLTVGRNIFKYLQIVKFVSCANAPFFAEAASAC